MFAAIGAAWRTVQPKTNWGDAGNQVFFWTTWSNELKLKSMNKTKEQWNTILRNETLGFLLMIALSWLTELFCIPHYLFGEPFAPDWNRALLRTFVILLIWGWVRWMTKKLLKRLHYLEEFLRICSWCRKVCHNGEWMTVDEYFNSKFATRTSHGMCPECSEKWRKEFDQTTNASSNPDGASVSQGKEKHHRGEKRD